MMNIKNETTGLFIEMLSEDNEPVYTSDRAAALLVTEEDLVEILEKWKKTEEWDVSIIPSRTNTNPFQDR